MHRTVALAFWAVNREVSMSTGACVVFACDGPGMASVPVEAAHGATAITSAGPSFNLNLSRPLRDRIGLSTAGLFNDGLSFSVVSLSLTTAYFS